MNERTTVVAVGPVTPEDLRVKLRELSGSVYDLSTLIAKMDAEPPAIDGEHEALEMICALVNMHDLDLHRASTIAEALGWVHFGRETIQPVRPGGNALHYLNQGDTYSTTLCQEIHPNDGTRDGFEGTTRGPVFVGCWGGWVEGEEQTHCEEENEVRCCYCGYWTPADDEYTDTTCQHCERNVSTGELPG